MASTALERITSLAEAGNEIAFLDAATALLKTAATGSIDKTWLQWLRERMRQSVAKAPGWEGFTRTVLAHAYLDQHLGALREAFFLFERAARYAGRAGLDWERTEAVECAAQLRPRVFQPFGALRDHLAAYERFLRDLLRHHIDIQQAAGRYGSEGEPKGRTSLSSAELGHFFERRTPDLEVVYQEHLKRTDTALRVRDEMSREKGLRIPLVEVCDRFGLSRLDGLILMINAAAARHRSLNRVLRHAMNDFGADAPFPSFLQELLAPILEPGESVLDRFEPEAPLMRQGFVRLFRHSDLPPKQSRPLVVDESVIATLYGRETISEAVLDISEVLPVQPSTVWKELVPVLVRGLTSGARVPGVAFLLGMPGAGRKTLAACVAGEVGCQGLLVLRLQAIRGLSLWDKVALMLAAVRDAHLRNLALCLESRSVREEHPLEDGEIQAALMRILPSLPLPCFLLSDTPIPMELKARFFDVPETRLGELSASQKVGMWDELEQQHQCTTDRPEEVTTLLQSLALNPGALQRLYGTSLAGARNRASEQPRIVVDDLKRSAVEEIDSELSGIAVRLPLTLDWGDIVLPDETLVELNEIISFARYRTTVLKDWGFERKLPYGKALSALFYGPPGTGKTMMAMIIAKDLGMELFRVDLSQIVSKYIGETEKNLKRVFDQAADGRAIILFEEADSLFSKRTNVSTSNDRYSNVEINYLLQKMETFEGVTVLTSNNYDNIDEAFRRRIRFKIKFPMPSVEHRSALWKVMFPKQAKVARDVDFQALAKAYEFAPAFIKNAVIRAAFKAAELGVEISQELLDQAARTESKQLGLLVREN